MARQARIEVSRYTWAAVREQWAAVYDGHRSLEHAGVPRESES
jgi:hypothetical protein